MDAATNKSTCLYCGNNPVPHFLTWYFETANTALAPVRKLLLYNPVSEWIFKLFKKYKLAYWLVLTGKFLGILKFNMDAAGCKVARAKVLWEEAKKRGIDFYELAIFGKTFDTYVAKKANKIVVFSGLPRPDEYNAKILEALDDKILLKKILQHNKLPVPQGWCVWNWRAAVRAFERLPKPVIIKPRSGSRGRHTTTFIYTAAELRQAFKVAKQLCFWVVVEQQLLGPVYRGTVINFKTRGLLRGDPPTVIGNGQKTIAELIQKFNQDKPNGVREMVVTGLTESFLTRQNLSLQTVLAEGQIVTLSEKIGVSYGGSSSEELQVSHPDNLKIFEDAAGALQEPLVGFDFIIPNITRSYKEQTCGFIEANSLPFINLHHNPLHGRPENVAKYVWEMIGF